MNNATGPAPKDRVSVPRPANQAPRPAAPAPRPAPRAAAPALQGAVEAPAPRRRGAPTKAEREAKLAKEAAEQQAYEQPFAEETEVVEGQEGEIPAEATVDEQAEEIETFEPDEDAAVEPEIEPVRAPTPPPRAAAPTAKPLGRPASNINPNPTPSTRRPVAAPQAAPRTPVEHRAAAGGNVRPGKEIAARPANAVQAATPHASSALKGDITIPRILLMQGSSQLVKDRKAQVGDIVRSSNGERLGGSRGPDEPADPVDIIPLVLSQSWTLMSGDGKTFEGTEPRNAANDGLPWEFEGEDGNKHRRLKTVDAIVMVASDIQRLAEEGGVAVDEDGIPLDLDSSIVLPHAVSFKSTGFAAGKGISTFFARVEALMKTHPLTRPYHFTLPLSCYPEQDEGNEWHVYDVGAAKRTGGNLVQEARQWYENLATRNVVLEDEAAAEQQADAALAPAPKGAQRRSQF